MGIFIPISLVPIINNHAERLTPPSGWRGPTPVLYRSSDSPSGITLREASGGQGRPTLVSGKVKCTLI